MKIQNMVGLLTLMLSLSACQKSSSPVALACTSLHFEPTKLQYDDSSIPVRSLRLDLVSGDAVVSVTGNGQALNCTHRMSALELNDLKAILKKGVRYCGPRGTPSKSLHLTGASNQVFSMSEPSSQTVEMSGGYAAFEADLDSFIEEVKTSGNCSGVAPNAGSNNGSANGNPSGVITNPSAGLGSGLQIPGL